MSDPKERLVRIMGTFDLATGHADTWDELLDSLESELRDVLGHYREALKQHLVQEPVAMLERDPSIVETHKCNTHPNAPHGFLRNASHNAGRYVCECEHWKGSE
jgi:hypothetical protein